MAVDLERAKEFLNSGGYSRNHNQDLISQFFGKKSSLEMALSRDLFTVR